MPSMRNEQRPTPRLKYHYEISECHKWRETFLRVPKEEWERIRFASGIYSETLNTRKQCFNTFQNLRGNYFQSRSL